MFSDYGGVCFVNGDFVLIECYFMYVVYILICREC